MKTLRVVIVLGVLLGLTVFSQSAWAYQEFVISCEGTRCNGGGTWEYQYTLMNVSGAPVTLREFILGTQDITEANYSFLQTPEFYATVVPNGGPGSQTYTTTLETPHGVVPPQSGGIPSTANVWWQGYSVIPDGGTITFGFQHPNEPWDHEWFAIGSQPTQFTAAQLTSPIAGPIGVYTDGYVHAPGPEEHGECCSLEMEKNDGWVPPASGTGCAVYVVAQSFTPLEDYQLCDVAVVLQNYGDDTATLYVQDDPSDTPATIHTQGTIGPIGGEGWYHCDVPDVYLTAGSTYYIRVVANVSWKHDDSDPYPRGTAYQDETELGFRDHYFITYTYMEETRVEMSSMAAHGRDGFVEVEWVTETEIDHAGFYLDRCLSKDGPFMRISDGMIPAAGDGLTGQRYSYTDRDVVNGLTYHYKVVSVDLSGETATYGPVSATAGGERSPMTAGFVLERNYPDPLSPITEIRYHLTEACQVKLDVYNILGQRVATLVDDEQTAGTKVVSWAVGHELPGGTYFCTLQAGRLFDTRKMIVLK